VFTFVWFLAGVSQARPTVNLATTLGGFLYTAGLGGFAGLLLTQDNGTGLVLGVAIPVIAYDVVAYFVGKQFGKARLAPGLSPNKTVEGLIGGMAGSVIAAVLIVKQIHPWGDLGDVLALGFTVAVIAPIGDLAESMLKRDLGIKDFGSFLPGHGGLLDRFDGLLFCLPAVYFLVRALTPGF
jgi:phosphatidate cytidylyltransferase